MAILGKLGRYTDTGLLLLRLGLGAMMVFHGYPKLIGGPEKWESIGKAMDNLGVHTYHTAWGAMAAATECIGGLLIVLGLFFRPVSVLMMFTMFVAVVHHIKAGDSIGDASHAIELCFVFLGLIFVGPGKYSVDKS